MEKISDVVTPSLVISEIELLRYSTACREMAEACGCRVLCSIKSCGEFSCLEILASVTDGFSCSSVFEASLASCYSEPGKVVQIVTPGLTRKFLATLEHPPNLLTFNSIEQFVRLVDATDDATRLAIRVNPKTRFVKNEKYDPCRVGSKLGVNVEKIIKEFQHNDLFRDRITGLHVHNNCESDDFEQLRETVEILKPILQPEFGLDWINLGGGYDFFDADPVPFQDVVKELVDEFGLEVFFEPGGGLVREAGYLVSTIVDMFDSDGDAVAILDTTVNHAPEVFEYAWSPPVLGSVKDGAYQYTLAGCSCLAGDVFGKYKFENPLKVGDKVVFGSLGAYAMPKWSYFNGINLPTIYLLTKDGDLILKKSFTFEEFASRCGVEKIAFN